MGQASPVMSKSLVIRALYFVRDLRSRAAFDALRKFARGSVLDVGGWDFVVSAIAKKIPFDRWTVLEARPHANRTGRRRPGLDRARRRLRDDVCG